MKHGGVAIGGAILPEWNDEWQIQHTDMTLEAMAGRGDDPAAARLQAT